MNLINYAKQFIGTRYQWGGNGGGAFDCSGFIQEILASQGLDPKGDQTAQQLYDLLKNDFKDSKLSSNSILFFGKSVNSITHCAFHIGNSQMIEAAGGGSKTNSEDDAIKTGAMVRIRPILSRNDLVGAISVPVGEFYGEM